MISGRADLRIGVSEAKFDVEVDFDVKKSIFRVVFEKLRQNGTQNQLDHQILLQIHLS